MFLPVYLSILSDSQETNQTTDKLVQNLHHQVLFLDSQTMTPFPSKGNNKQNAHLQDD